MRLVSPDHRSWIALLLLGVLITASTVNTARIAHRYAVIPPGSGMYHDLRIFLRLAGQVRDDGRLYKTDAPDFAVPGSSVYKYPPTWAALLQPLTGLHFKTAARILFGVYAAILLASLVILLRLHRPALPRTGLILLAFISWQPFWESMAGMQLEIVTLLLLAVMLALRPAGRRFWSGVPIGLAGALKLYPLGLVAWLAWRRDVRAIGGAAAGLAIAFVASSLVLPARLWREFVILLPGLGGTNVGPDNLSLVGMSGRLGVALFQGPEVLREATSLGRVQTDLAVLGTPATRIFAVAAAAIAAAGLLLLSWRALRSRALSPAAPAGRGAAAAGDWTEPLSLGAFLCLLLLSMPTSWPDYQTLLFLPLVTVLATAPGFRTDPWPLALGITALVSGAIPVDWGPLARHADWTPAVRGWLPIALWAALMRIAAGRSTSHLRAQ